ncbi:MAG: L,D-transpeptidase family protein, partial [Roseimicrobium sp.]
LHGADPNAPGLGGHTPVVLASLRRHPQLLRIALAAGGAPNTRFGEPITKSFLSIVPDPYLRDELRSERGFTPLMVCSARGDVEAVALLLRWGANKQLHTLPHYRYPINFAADKRYLYIMRLLLGRDPESEPHVLVTVDLSQQKTWLDVEGKTVLKTTVSTGRRGYGTPAGRYVITNKYKHWVSTLYKVPMPYFMRLNCGAIGLHSGHVTGQPASHGCIRLPNEMAKKFFELVNVGDEVTIQY